MSEIYYAFIILPIIIMSVFTFIFQSSVAELEVQQFRMQCPYPTIHVDVNDATLTSDNRITYTIVHNQTVDFTNDIFVFQCNQSDSIGFSLAFYNSTSSFFTVFDNAFAWLGYLHFTIGEFFNKVQAGITMLYLLFTAPAQVTGLGWFTYINVILTAFIGLGIFMMVRGN